MTQDAQGDLGWESGYPVALEERGDGVGDVEELVGGAGVEDGGKECASSVGLERQHRAE